MIEIEMLMLTENEVHILLKLVESKDRDEYNFAIRKLRDLNCIGGKLACENAKNLTDKELNRCLKRCIGGHYLVPLAKLYRDEGKIKLVKIGYGEVKSKAICQIGRFSWFAHEYIMNEPTIKILLNQV